MQIGTVYFTGDKPTLIIKYETKTSFDDVPALTEEAREVAQLYQSTFKESGRDAAFLSANEPMPNTLISKTRGYNFLFRKQADGTWKLEE